MVTLPLRLDVVALAAAAMVTVVSRLLPMLPACTPHQAVLVLTVGCSEEVTVTVASPP